MKTTKKVLGIVLALVMLMNVFAVSGFAAGSESAVDLYLSADKKVYAPGDEIVLTFSAQTVPLVGDITIGGQFAIGYDSAAIQPYSNDVSSLTAHGFTAIVSEYDSTNSGITDPLDKTVDAGWDSFIIYNCVDTGVAVDATTKTDLFSLKMKVSETAADGTYTIGFNKSSYQAYEAYVTDMANGGIYGYDDDYGYETAVNYGFNNVTIEVSSAPAVTVESKGTMAHMNNWEDTEATTYTAGLVGQINGLALTFDETTGECNEIEEIKVTIEGSDEVGYAYQVYKVDETTYQFRAILLNTPKTGTTALNYTFHVKLADGSTVTCSDSTTAKEIFDAAYARYEAAKNA